MSQNIALLRGICPGNGIASMEVHTDLASEELRKVMVVYAEGRVVEAVAFLGDATHGVVLTRETFTNSGTVVDYRGVHLWTFENGHCISFEAFAHALTVFLLVASPV